MARVIPRCGGDINRTVCSGWLHLTINVLSCPDTLLRGEKAALSRFELLSLAPKAGMIDRYTTGLQERCQSESILIPMKSCNNSWRYNDMAWMLLKRSCN